MRIIDVDAHLHEPLDWVARTDPGLADALGPPARFFDIASSVFGFNDKAFETLPEVQRPKERFDLVPPGFVHHLQLTDELQPAEQQRGIDVQFLNPTFLVGAFVQAGRARRIDLLPRVRRCWNDWSTSLVAGHTDRLMPVTQIDFSDVEGTIAELTRTRELGCRAFAVPETPVRGARGTLARSITHPDFEPIWDAAEDLGMAAFFHVGFGRERINPGWANNGAADMKTFSLLSMIAGGQTAPQLLIAALVYDGVLERHPQLNVVIEEVGIDWLPYVLSAMEASIGHTTLPRDDEFRPSHLSVGDTYTLPLTPTEYVRRQVRVTPLPASNPIGRVITNVPPEVLCFSSDYPHVEGSASAVELCSRQLDEVDADPALRGAFFGGVGELLGV
jgi:predicted TIM-barrel fold metal-dependent hydrolase